MMSLKNMKIQWLGHSCFLIEQDGIRLVTDPFTQVGYPELMVAADLCTISHEHGDHNYVNGILGTPSVFRGSGRKDTPEGWNIEGFAAYHDEVEGEKRGLNTLFLIEVGGIRVLHLGDLGHRLDEQLLETIGRVDVLMIPVGGFFTIDAQEASDITKDINPTVILPMHYRTAANPGFPISTEEPFLQLAKVVEGPIPMLTLDAVTLHNSKQPRTIIMNYPI
jgi:L-ascorbate metabolism protein UlaG (beta-lactamase superfamily)